MARELDLTETAVRRWVNQADVDAGTSRVDQCRSTEIAKLRKELREVTEERDILARAVSFFASVSK